MTRKRFVKKLMARRWTRNEANEIAMNIYAYVKTKKTYSSYFRFVCLFLDNGRV